MEIVPAVPDRWDDVQAVFGTRSQVPWAGRHEDKDDDGVWAVTCSPSAPDTASGG